VADAERERFAHFFRAEYDRVVRVVAFIVHDRGRAEEIAQDAFVKAFDRWRQVGQYTNPDAWVRRVAVRMAVRFARRERIRPQLEAAAAPSPIGGADASPDVLGAMELLPARQRAVVTLFYLEDRSVDDIAGILRCSSSTVKVHLHRARRTLASVVGEEVRRDADHR
jgi:RNA polymerase sigma-70 factor, ECF subfamily